MVGGQVRKIMSQVPRIIGRQGGSTLTDAQLLEAFVSRRDEASFEVLVWRHAAMVQNLCQRVLRDAHEAEDAFQATFLVFARKAGSIGNRDALGGWLYKVASRVAFRLRAKGAKRDARQQPVDDVPAEETADNLPWRDLRPILDEEINRLPEKYRAAVVLCYLEGHTNEEAAAQLGCPKGTVVSRLARGRERLRGRLTRRGVTLSALAMAVALSKNASAAVPAAIVSSTVKAAVPFAAGQAAAGLMSAPVAALTKGVLHTMFLTKLTIATAVVLAVAVVGPGAGVVAHRVWAEAHAARGGDCLVRPPAEQSPRPTNRDTADSPSFMGRVVAVASDGKSIMIEPPGPARTRGAEPPEEPKKIQIAIAGNTQVIYSGVAPNGAKLTEGYLAQVWTVPGSTTEAAKLLLVGNRSVRPPADLAGKVAKVSADGKTISFVEPSAEGNRDALSVDVRLTAKTAVTYSFVPQGGVKPTGGYSAQVWLERGSKDVAARVNFDGNEPRPRRGESILAEEEPDRLGKILAVSPDGKVVTIEARARDRGDEPLNLQFKINDQTKVVYSNVGPGGDKPAEGYQVQLWLVKGSTDTAAKVYFTAPLSEQQMGIRAKVIGVPKEGQGVILETRPQSHGEEPGKWELHFTDRTTVVYQDVGPGGAKPTAGYFAQVWLVEGSNDVADKVMLGASGERH
jgi:RNA polymerase sigma factor (sigma-70 family)